MSEALVHVNRLGSEAITLPSTGQKAEVIMKEISISEKLIYKLGGGQVGMLSSGWDFVGGERGISFLAPEVLENTEDRVLVKVECKYFNRLGQEVRDSEVYEIDCRRLYELSRLEWAPPEYIDEVNAQGNKIWEETKWGKRPKQKRRSQAELAKEIADLQAKGILLDTPVYDEHDVPVGYKRKLPPEVEKTIWQNFLTLKRNKLPKAITCAHRRLIQRAIGTKTLDARNLTLHFPAVSAAFSTVDAERSVREIFGEEDVDLVAEMQGRQPAIVDAEEVIEGEVVAEESAPTVRVQEQAPKPAESLVQGHDDARAALVEAIKSQAKQLYGPEALPDNPKVKVWMRKLGEDLIRWNSEASNAGATPVCAQLPNGNPKLDQSTIPQLEAISRRYDDLLMAEALGEPEAA